MIGKYCGGDVFDGIANGATVGFSDVGTEVLGSEAEGIVVGTLDVNECVGISVGVEVIITVVSNVGLVVTKIGFILGTLDGSWVVGKIGAHVIKIDEGRFVVGKEEGRFVVGKEEGRFVIGIEEGRFVVGKEDGRFVVGMEEGRFVVGKDEGRLVVGNEEGRFVIGKKEGTLVVGTKEGSSVVGAIVGLSDGGGDTGF